jgi:hypothetical protein
VDRSECHAEAERVGGHVPRVGQQRQRARDQAGHDLHDEEGEDQEERGAQGSFVPRACSRLALPVIVAVTRH